MPERPSIVYKYESFNVRSLLNLKAQSLCFGSPRSFNDPYDCAITATVADPSDKEIEIAKQRYLNDATLPIQLRQRFASLSFDELKQQIINGANKGLMTRGKAS